MAKKRLENAPEFHRKLGRETTDRKWPIFFVQNLTEF
jgi:hypothetical protein